MDFTIDTTAPTVGVSIGVASLGPTLQPVVVTFKFSEAIDGFALGDIEANGGTLNSLSHSVADPLVYTAIFSPSENYDGTASIAVRPGSYEDLAGNPGAPGVASFAVDTVPPAHPVQPISLDFVTPFYDGLLDRSCSAEEDAGWLQTIARDHLLSQAVAQGFLTSSEYTLQHGNYLSGSDADFVALLYDVTLHRGVEAAGLQTWTDHLASGMSRAEVAADIVQAPEHLATVQVA